MNIGTLHFEADFVGIVGKAGDACLRFEIRAYANGKEYVDHVDYTLGGSEAVMDVEDRVDASFEGVDPDQDQFVFEGTNDAGHSTFGRVAIPQSLIPDTHDRH